jgi:hypothetical protein
MHDTGMEEMYSPKPTNFSTIIWKIRSAWERHWHKYKNKILLLFLLYSTHQFLLHLYFVLLSFLHEILKILWHMVYAWLLFVGSRVDDWIYWTSLLQLPLIIAAHTLNSFWITNLSLLSESWRVSSLSNSRRSQLLVLILSHSSRSLRPSRIYSL